MLKSLKNVKNIIHPNKTENLLIFELVILIILVYYDVIFNFPADPNISLYLIILLIGYISFFILFYLFERRKILEFGYHNRFFLFTQVSFSFFLGILLSLVYYILKNNEIISAIISTIPLAFLILIGLFQKISSHQIERFLKKYILKDEIWTALDEQTRKDFKQAELSIRTDNVPNAIINLSKGIERELKLAIFHPFKEAVNQLSRKEELFAISKPFKKDGSDPRERTYENFRFYLEGKRHLTFGNIPFFLLNLTDNKMGNHTDLFAKFSEYLKERLGEQYQNIIKISKILFNHEYFSISGIKISDLRNEAAHPQKEREDHGSIKPSRSESILSIDNYIALIKVLAVKPNLLKLIVDIKK